MPETDADAATARRRPALRRRPAARPGRVRRGRATVPTTSLCVALAAALGATLAAAAPASATVPAAVPASSPVVAAVPASAPGAAAGVRVPAAAAAQKVTLTGPSSAYQGVSTRLTVTWRAGATPKAGTVTVQQLVSGRWYLVGTVRTAAKGASKGTATISVRPSKTATFRARTSTGVVSTRKVLTIRPPYALTARGATTVTKGRPATLSTTYTLRGAGVGKAKVRLQRLAGSTWTTVASRTTTARGTASVAVTPGASTSYRFVASPPSPARTVVSPTARVTVRAPAAAARVPSSFTVHGSGYGHGVGLSQYGAYAQALAGRSAATILGSYYRGTKVQTVTTPSTIHVQVWGPEPYGYRAGAYSDTGRTTSVTITGGPWRVVSAAGKVLASGQGTATLAVGVSGSAVTVTAPAGTKRTTLKGASLRVQWSGTRYYAASGARALATVQGAHGTYRDGQLTLSAIGGQPNVVNDLLLNTEYLDGIAEMPSSWGVKGRAALSAQAIVARGYALAKAGTLRKACGCNVVDDVRDQYFSGWKKAVEATYGRYWVAAVAATATSSTRAQVVTYGGRPVATHYFSSSGGGTANAKDVWSTDLPYERSVSDPWSLQAPGNSMAAWTRTLSQASARSLFGLPDVARIRVSATWPGGLVRTLTATSSTGRTATLTGKPETMRSRLGLPAAWVSSIG